MTGLLCLYHDTPGAGMDSPVHDKFNTLFSMVTVLEKLSRNEGRAAKVKDEE